jgi:serine/threonine-protein kinase
MDPNYSIVYWYQAQSCAGRKLWDEAIASSQKHVQLSGGAAFALATLGLVYGLAGMRDEALNALEQLIALSKERYVSPFQLAFVYIGLGEKEQALENMEKAYTDRESMIVYLGTFPFFDSVRSEPRIEEAKSQSHTRNSSSSGKTPIPACPKSRMPGRGWWG